MFKGESTSLWRNFRISYVKVIVLTLLCSVATTAGASLITVSEVSRFDSSLSFWDQQRIVAQRSPYTQTTGGFNETASLMFNGFDTSLGNLVSVDILVSLDYLVSGYAQTSPTRMYGAAWTDVIFAGDGQAQLGYTFFGSSELLDDTGFASSGQLRGVFSDPRDAVIGGSNSIRVSSLFNPSSSISLAFDGSESNFDNFKNAFSFNFNAEGSNRLLECRDGGNRVNNFDPTDTCIVGSSVQIYNGTFVTVNYNYQVSDSGPSDSKGVPEPGTLVLFGLALLALRRVRLSGT